MGLLILTSISLLMGFHEICRTVGKQMFDECICVSCQLVKPKQTHAVSLFFVVANLPQ